MRDASHVVGLVLLTLLYFILNLVTLSCVSERPAPECEFPAAGRGDGQRLGPAGTVTASSRSETGAEVHPRVEQVTAPLATLVLK